MMLHRVACNMVLQRRAAAARELYPTSPAYRSRPRPSAGRSRRVRLLIWARRVAASRLRPSDGTCTAVLWRLPLPMLPLATQVRDERFRGLGAVQSHRPRA